MSLPNLANVTTEEKFAMIDELWESVRHSGTIEMRADHLAELDARTEAIAQDPTLALSPDQARALFKM